MWRTACGVSLLLSSMGAANKWESKRVSGPHGIGLVGKELWHFRIFLKMLSRWKLELVLILVFGWIFGAPLDLLRLKSPLISLLLLIRMLWLPIIKQWVVFVMVGIFNLEEI